MRESKTLFEPAKTLLKLLRSAGGKDEKETGTGGLLEFVNIGSYPWEFGLSCRGQPMLHFSYRNLVTSRTVMSRPVEDDVARFALDLHCEGKVGQESPRRDELKIALI